MQGYTVTSCKSKTAWRLNGLLHRAGDFPAVLHSNGVRCWYKNGKLHRDGGKPAIECPDGIDNWHEIGVNWIIEG